MARDEVFHELAVAFPEAVLQLVGAAPAGPYASVSRVLKRTERRIDEILVPEDPGDPHRVVEMQRRRDEDVERNLLEKVVLLAGELEIYDRLEAIVIYARPELRRDALSAAVGTPAGALVSFEPRRVVLSELAPEPFEEAGGTALVVLPLVGSEEGVRERAVAWRRRISEEPVPSGAQERRRREDVFLMLLADRLSTMDVMELFGEEDRVRDTVTGQRLLKEGELRVLERQLQARLREEYEPFAARVARCDSEQIDAVADLLVRRLSRQQLAQALDEILPPEGEEEHGGAGR